MRNKITEIQDTPKEINSRLDDKEGWVSELEDTELNRKKRKKIQRNEYSLEDLRGNTLHTNICITRVQKGKEREKGAQNIFEDIIFKNFANLDQERDIQIQDAQTVTNRINPKRSIQRHIVLKQQNNK